MSPRRFSFATLRTVREIGSGALEVSNLLRIRRAAPGGLPAFSNLELELGLDARRKKPG